MIENHLLDDGQLVEAKEKKVRKVERAANRIRLYETSAEKMKYELSKGREHAIRMVARSIR